MLAPGRRQDRPRAKERQREQRTFVSQMLSRNEIDDRGEDTLLDLTTGVDVIPKILSSQRMDRLVRPVRWYRTKSPIFRSRNFRRWYDRAPRSIATSP